MRNARKVAHLRRALLLSCGVAFPLTATLSVTSCTAGSSAPPPACIGASVTACPDASFSSDSDVPTFDAQADRAVIPTQDGSSPGVDTGSPLIDGSTDANDAGASATDASDAAVVSINEWTWMSGSNTTLVPGTYGTLGDAGPANTPGARYGAASWSDSAGRLWLFGGTPVDGIPMMNDLWKFDGTEWTWMGGSNTTNATGVYTTADAGAGGSFPGARYFAAGATDSHGNFWLFGGKGFGAASSEGWLSDLWKFDGINWSWVAGDTAVNVAASYGSADAGADAGPLDPGGRNRCLSWVDPAGNFWLFGGRDPAGTVRNDLWKYDGAKWTWETGSSAPNAAGVYGTKGTGAVGNTPGAREDSVSWTDASGTLWLYGGWGYDSAGLLSDLGDLWKFDGRTWTWVFGSNVGNGAASYVPAGDPGGRENAAFGADALGGFWLMSGTSSHNSGELNDVWRFDGAKWTWVTGGSSPNATGTYGAVGDAGASFIFGGRDSASGWVGPGGSVWVFGGWGYGASGSANDLNDLWRYQP